MTTPTPKRTRGRPPVPPEERGASLTVRVSPELRSRVEAAAEDLGESLGEYVRVALEDRLRRGPSDA